MKLILFFVISLVPTIVWSQKNSCVCDCDAIASAENISSTKAPTKPPKVTNKPSVAPEYIPGQCQCLQEYKTSHLFCGSRRDQLTGDCEPEYLYNCGLTARRAVLHKRCHSCVQIISEDWNGKDQCRN